LFVENSSLVELLKTLTTKELKAFKDFLLSPYHSPQKYPKEVLQLYEILYKHAPAYQNPKLEREKVQQQIFQEKEGADSRLERVMVELNKCLRNFLLLERYLGQEQQQQQLDFAQLLTDRGLTQRAAQQLTALQSSLDKITSKTLEDEALAHRTALMSYKLEARKNTWRKDLNIQQALRSQDVHFLAGRINLLTHYLLLSKLAKVDVGIDLERERQLFDLLDIREEESSSIFIARKIFDLYTIPPSREAFESLHALLRLHESKMNEVDIKQYFVFLRNQCNFCIGSGSIDLWPVLHELHKDNLQKGYLYYNNDILPGGFLSISNTALHVGNFDWAQQFIEAHKGRIIGDNESHDYYRFSMANLHFHRGEYDEALSCIPSTFGHLDYHLMALRLELMIYYETSSDLLSYKIDALKMYLSRNRHSLLSEENYEMNSSFVNILYQLSQSHSRDKERAAKILQRIEDKKYLIAKEWLIKMCQKLMSR
jgi:hypothetical protein